MGENLSITSRLEGLAGLTAFVERGVWMGAWRSEGWAERHGHGGTVALCPVWSSLPVSCPSLRLSSIVCLCLSVLLLVDLVVSYVLLSPEFVCVSFFGLFIQISLSHTSKYLSTLDEKKKT